MEKGSIGSREKGRRKPMSTSHQGSSNSLGMQSRSLASSKILSNMPADRSSEFNLSSNNHDIEEEINKKQKVLQVVCEGSKEGVLGKEIEIKENDYLAYKIPWDGRPIKASIMNNLEDMELDSEVMLKNDKGQKEYKAYKEMRRMGINIPAHKSVKLADKSWNLLMRRIEVRKLEKEDKEIGRNLTMRNLKDIGKLHVVDVYNANDDRFPWVSHGKNAKLNLDNLHLTKHTRNRTKNVIIGLDAEPTRINIDDKTKYFITEKNMMFTHPKLYADLFAKQMVDKLSKLMATSNNPEELQKPSNNRKLEHRQKEAYYAGIRTGVLEGIASVKKEGGEEIGQPKSNRKKRRL
ncbi:MAG: hypothetical protein F6K21_26185 [Symploca sp. SIO2D2]|nr:hypothetical protein [Symploca sp. SIO2D2]